MGELYFMCFCVLRCLKHLQTSDFLIKPVNFYWGTVWLVIDDTTGSYTAEMFLLKTFLLHCLS